MSLTTNLPIGFIPTRNAKAARAFYQDSLGIWDAPGGSRVAWFHDPDGNTLSFSQHPK